MNKRAVNDEEIDDIVKKHKTLLKERVICYNSCTIDIIIHNTIYS